MLGCCFTASGAFFDVDSYLDGCTFEADSVFYRGEPMMVPRGQSKPASGFSKHICHTRVFGDLAAQIPQAVSFLREARAEIQRLRDWPGVTELRIVFPFCTGGFAVADAALPAELVALAGELGIGLVMSVYPGEAPTDDDAQEEAQSGAPPNDGPAAPVADSGVNEGPPSAS